MFFRSVVVLFLLAELVLAREPAPLTNDLSLASLRIELAAHLTKPQFRGAQWGIKIVSLDSETVLFESNAEKLLKPASNTKLYTGALALDLLGPDYRIRTSLYSRNATNREGVLEGDLIVYGRGDPSFSSRFENGDYANIFGRIVEAVRSAGIKRIEGDLIGDDTFFSGSPYGASWTWDDLQYFYGAEVSALSVQDNAIDLFLKPGNTVGEPCRVVTKPSTDFVQLINQTKTSSAKGRAAITIERPLGENRAYISGSLPKDYATWTDAVTVSKPALWFVQLLQGALAREGIQVTGRNYIVSNPDKEKTDTGKLKELAFTLSPPLSLILEKMLKPSQNLYAQLLLLQAGAQLAASESETDTQEIGLKRLLEFVKRAGIDPNEVLLEEGSGLSRGGLVTANATVQLLKYMSRHKNAELYRASLPVAGTDGTLRSRLQDLKGKVRAKTGTIRFVNSLSGYMTTRAGEELAFSIMLNAYNAPAAASRDEVDAIPRLLFRLNERTNNSK